LLRVLGQPLSALFARRIVAGAAANPRMKHRIRMNMRTQMSRTFEEARSIVWLEIEDMSARAWNIGGEKVNLLKAPLRHSWIRSAMKVQLLFATHSMSLLNMIVKKNLFGAVFSESIPGV
jgi:hypothetical protein